MQGTRDDDNECALTRPRADSPLSRLHFQKYLYGREDELKALQNVYSNVCTESDHPHQPDIAFIMGKPGTGKTALVHQFASRIDENEKNPDEPTTRQCYFICGKFVELDGGDPFRALTEAFNSFCRQVLDGDDEDCQEMREAIKKGVCDEGKILIEIIPDLASIVGDLNDLYDNENNWNRLIYRFRSFLQVICSSAKPVVLFLDDLQWADDASLELLKHVLTDATIKNFMFIGAYRSDELNTAHSLDNLLEVVKKERDVTAIEVQELSIDVLGQFVAETLDREVQETESLTNVVYEKTKGNMFFTMQVLEDLRRRQLLKRTSKTDSRWVWDSKQINLLDAISENVEEVVTSKIASLPAVQRRVLSLAAFLRFKFDADTLLSMLFADELILDREELYEILESAVFEGLLLNSIGSNFYSFVHDRFKEAALAILTQDTENYSTLRLRLAESLLKRGQSTSGEDWMLFVALDHLNDTPTHSLTPLEMARLNLKVGEKAVKVSAYVPASRYLRCGIEELASIDSAWQHYYDLTLRLYHGAAEIESCLGDYEIGSKYCNLVIDNARSSVAKLRAYLLLANSLGRQSRHSEAIVVHSKALSQIGEFPKHFTLLHAAINYRKVAKLLKQSSDFDILLLPQMGDECKLLIMDHLDHMAIRAYHCNHMSVVVLCVLKLIRLSFKHGVSFHTANAFASFAVISFGPLANYKQGGRMAKLTLDILRGGYARGTTREKLLECQALFRVQAYIEAYSKPLSDVLETLQYSQKCGFESGDLENAFRSWASANTIAYAAGLSLHSIEESSGRLLEQLGYYKVDALISLVVEFRFAIMRLTGKSPVPIDWNQFTKCSLLLEGDKGAVMFTLNWIYWSRLQVAYYFRKFEIADTFIPPFQSMRDVDTTFATTSIRVLFSGLTEAALARETGKKVYLRRARKSLAEMDMLTRAKGLNNLHRYLLMEAEFDTCDPCANGNNFLHGFDGAIQAAEIAGYRQDAALGNELAGESLLRQGNDDDVLRSRPYFTKAYRLYLEWGAKAKAKHLKELRGDYIDQDRQKSSDDHISSNASRHQLEPPAEDIGVLSEGNAESCSTTSSSKVVSLISTPSGSRNKG